MEVREPAVPCRALRTKLYAMNPEAGRAYLVERIPTEHYWCLWTMGPAGPDERPADPECCVARRACYRELGEGG